MFKAFEWDILWKKEGGASSSLSGNSVIYQSYKNKLYALNQFDGKTVWEKEMRNNAIPLPPVVFKDYLVYGFPSNGKLIFANVKDGKTLTEYKFGRGLAAPVSVDQENNNIYFLSIDGYLHKISVLY